MSCECIILTTATVAWVKTRGACPSMCIIPVSWLPRALPIVVPIRVPILSALSSTTQLGADFLLSACSDSDEHGISMFQALLLLNHNTSLVPITLRATRFRVPTVYASGRPTHLLVKTSLPAHFFREVPREGILEA